MVIGEAEFGRGTDRQRVLLRLSASRGAEISAVRGHRYGQVSLLVSVVYVR